VRSNASIGSLGGRQLTVAIAALICAFTAVAADVPTFCEEMAAFARNVSETKPREIVFFAEWGADPTKACRLDNGDKVSQRFCDWLIEHASAEYMEANVRNAVSCLGEGKPDGTLGKGSIDYMTGKLRFYAAKVPHAEGVVFELQYSVRSKESPDMLLISVSRTAVSRK
jgi:hypothetical protein